MTDIKWADPGKCQALRGPMLAGAIAPPHGDTTRIRRVAISRVTARVLWAEGRVVGRRIAIQLFGATEAGVAAVVGVVHLTDVRTNRRPTVYFPIDRRPNATMDVVMHGDVPVGTLALMLRRTVMRLDRGSASGGQSASRGVSLVAPETRIRSSPLRWRRSESWYSRRSSPPCARCAYRRSRG